MNKKIKMFLFLLLIILFAVIAILNTIFKNKFQKYEYTLESNTNMLANQTSTENPKKLKILVIEFDPILKTKGNIKTSEYFNRKGDEKAIIDEVTSDLSYSSHGYVQCEIVDWIETNRFPPYTQEIQLSNGKKSHCFDEATWLDLMKDGYYGWWERPLAKTLGNYVFDYQDIIDKYNLVQRKNNNEFDWVFLSMTEPAQAYESVMVGNNAYWINGPSYSAKCSNFPIIFANLTRKDGILHSVGHMTENIMNNVFNTFSNEYKYYDKKAINIKNLSEYNSLNKWQKYILSSFNSNTTFNGIEHYGVGNVHFPANATEDYDYTNKTKVYSNWRDWQENYPNLKGQFELTSSSIWLDEHPSSGDDSADRRFQRWWFKNMPHISGRDGQGYYHNWWKYITTLDFVTEISSKTESLNLNIGNNPDKISYTCTYKSGKIQNISNNSGIQIKDTSILNISDDGILIGKKAGSTTANIWKDGKSISIPVKVLQTDTSNPKLTISYSTKEATNQPVVVTITSDEEILAVNGWTLSSDNKKISKSFTANYSGEVTVSDKAR